MFIATDKGIYEYDPDTGFWKKQAGTVLRNGNTNACVTFR